MAAATKTVSVLLLIVLLSIFRSGITHQLGLDLHHPWCLRSPFKRLLLLLFNVRLSQVNLLIIWPQDVNKTESRRTLLIRDQISSEGYWDHMTDKMNPRYNYYHYHKNNKLKLKSKFKAFGFKPYITLSKSNTTEMDCYWLLPCTLLII